MSKREQTTTVEDLYCDQSPCDAQAVGPCGFCPKDLCREHGDVRLNYDGLIVFICQDDRTTAFEVLFDPPDRVQRRFDEFNMARQAIIEV